MPARTLKYFSDDLVFIIRLFYFKSKQYQHLMYYFLIFRPVHIEIIFLYEKLYN